MRKLFTATVIIIFIIAWALGVSSLGGIISEQHFVVELVFYIIAGMGWAFPLIPLVRWGNRA